MEHLDIQHPKYDRIFKESNKRIEFSEFELAVDQHKKQIPRWFLNIKNVDTNNFETINVDGFYLTRNKQEKQVYFILTNQTVNNSSWLHK